MSKGAFLLLAVAVVCLTQSAWAMQAPEFVEVNEFLPSGPVHAATDSYILSSQEQAEEDVYNHLMKGVTISDDNQMVETFSVKPAAPRAIERPDVVLVENTNRAEAETEAEVDAEADAEANAYAAAQLGGQQRGIWGAIKKAGAKAVTSGINSLKNSANKFMDKIFGNAKKAKAKAKAQVKKAAKKMKKSKKPAGGKNDMPKIFGGAYKKVQGMYKKKDVDKLTNAFNKNHSKKSSTNIGEKAVDTSLGADNIAIKAMSAAQGMSDRNGRSKAPPTFHQGLPLPAAPRDSPSDRYASQKAGVLTMDDLPNI